MPGSCAYFKKLSLSFLLACCILNIQAQNKIQHDAPSPKFLVSGLCVGDSTYFTNITYGGASDYFWVIDNGKDSLLKSTNKNIAFLFTVPGTYHVYLRASNGHESSIDKYFLVDSLPHARFSYWQCHEKFINESTCAKQFLWELPDGSTSLLDSPDFAFSAAGTFPVKLVAKNGNKVDSFHTIINIAPDSIRRPTATFTYTNTGDTFYFECIDTIGTSYAWDFDDGTYDDSSGYKTQHVLPVRSTPYFISLSAANACSIHFYYTYITITGLKDDEQDALSLFPNPASKHEEVTIQWSDALRGKKADVSLLNGLSVDIFHQQVDTDQTTAFKLPTVAAGLYFIRVVFQDKVFIQKLIIQQ